MKKFFNILILILLCSSMLKAQNLEAYERHTYISGKDTLPYRILYPEGFDPAKKYPVIFFLHGSGEVGNNNEAQLTHGGSYFLRDSIRKNYPAIVVFPQCPANSYWANVNIIVDGNRKRFFNFFEDDKPTTAMSMALGLVETIRNKSYTDKNRIYVAGLSMGGMGTFEMLRRKPKYFAAAIPMCGGDNVRNVKIYKNIPLWIFHGDKDDIVSSAYSKIIVNELQRLGKGVKFSLYPEVNHGVWNNAFAEPELLKWLFEHHR